MAHASDLWGAAEVWKALGTGMRVGLETARGILGIGSRNGFWTPYPLIRAVERSLDSAPGVFSERLLPGGRIESRRLFSTSSWADHFSTRNPGRRITRADEERTEP